MLTSEANKSNTLPGSTLLIDGNSLKLEEIEQVALQDRPVAMSDGAVEQLAASRQVVEDLVKTGQPIYGITTGFGKFKDVTIKPEDSVKLQRNFMLSHAAGCGPIFDRATTRAMLLLRANALVKGFSGIRKEVVQLLVDCMNKKVHPSIPEQGSLGASGDLAPLAHLGLVLIGEGTATFEDSVMKGSEALGKAGLKPVVLGAKEGLALTNGTQMMSAVGTLTLLEAERLAKVADIIGVMSLEAQLGSSRAFREEIHQVRPHPGQLASAANLRKLLEQSEIVASHANCPMVQDAYSLRCMPQVHGASRQAFKHVREVLEIEVNAATDNPLVFDDGVLYGGNFHGQPIALAMDYLAIALAELANISERRTERLVNPALSNGLPAFLTRHGGLNSGFMIAQYTAAALVSENKSFAHPASVDSIPTSANQEDHVSMGSIAARKARMILNNTRRVLAIELLCAAQGLDIRMHGGGTKCGGGVKHADLKPGPAIAALHDAFRSHVPYLNEDRELHLDIARAERFVGSGAVIEAAESVLGLLH